jgi:hypothetical protein
MKKTALAAVLLLLWPLGAWGQQAKDAGRWQERLNLTGALEMDLHWEEGPQGEGASSLSLGTLELGAEVDIVPWLKGFLLLLAEDLGTSEATDLTVDEATLTLQRPDSPFYLVLGKRVQPFGLFENHLVADPWVQDAYETNRVGLTAGYRGPMDMDVSLTVYGGQEHLEHLFGSGLFDAQAVARRGEASEDVEAFIIAASFKPLQNRFFHLVAFGSYLSEPGRGRRNQSLDVGLSLAPPVLEGLRLDVEYARALRRELYEGLQEEFREAVLSATLAYEFVLREREVLGGGLFMARRAHLMAEPLELALRYEYFDDDGLAEATGSFSAKDRLAVGARYTFLQEGPLVAFLAAELYRTTYRVASGLSMDDEAQGLRFRLGLSF